MIMSFCPGSDAPVVNWFQIWVEIWNWILINSSSSFIVRSPCPPPTIVPSLSHKPKFYHDLFPWSISMSKARAPNSLLSALSPGSNPSQQTLIKARCQELFCTTCSSALCHFTQHKSPKTTRNKLTLCTDAPKPPQRDTQTVPYLCPQKPVQCSPLIYLPHFPPPNTLR